MRPLRIKSPPSTGAWRGFGSTFDLQYIRRRKRLSNSEFSCLAARINSQQIPFKLSFFRVDRNVILKGCMFIGFSCSARRPYFRFDWLITSFINQVKTWLKLLKTGWKWIGSGEPHHRKSLCNSSSILQIKREKKHFLNRRFWERNFSLVNYSGHVEALPLNEGEILIPRSVSWSSLKNRVLNHLRGWKRQQQQQTFH